MSVFEREGGGAEAGGSAADGGGAVDGGGAAAEGRIGRGVGGEDERAGVGVTRGYIGGGCGAGVRAGVKDRAR